MFKTFSRPCGRLVILVLASEEKGFRSPEFVHDPLEFRVSGLFSRLLLGPLSGFFADLLQGLLGVHLSFPFFRLGPMP